MVHSRASTGHRPKAQISPAGAPRRHSQTASGFIRAPARRFDWPPVDVEVVHVRVSPATLKHRLRERGPERDRWKLAHWDEYWSKHGARPCAWTNVRLTDFSNDADGVLNQRLERHRIHAPNTVASRRTAPAETFLYR